MQPKWHAVKQLSALNSPAAQTHQSLDLDGEKAHAAWRYWAGCWRKEKKGQISVRNVNTGEGDRFLKMPSQTYFKRKTSASKEILRTDSPHWADQEGNTHTHSCYLNAHRCSPAAEMAEVCRGVGGPLEISLCPRDQALRGMEAQKNLPPTPAKHINSIHKVPGVLSRSLTSTLLWPLRGLRVTSQEKVLIHATLATVPVVTQVTPEGVNHSFSESASSTPVGSDIFLNMANNLAFSLFQGVRVQGCIRLSNCAGTLTQETLFYDGFCFLTNLWGLWVQILAKSFFFLFSFF